MKNATLDQLLGMVTDISRKLIRGHDVNMGKALWFNGSSTCTRWVAPAKEGAVYLGYEIQENGIGAARLEVLPRMPKSFDDLNSDELRPIACFVASRHDYGGERFTLVESDPIDESDTRPLANLARDIETRFKMQKVNNGLAADLNYSESIPISVAA